MAMKGQPMQLTNIGDMEANVFKFFEFIFGEGMMGNIRSFKA